MNALSRYTLPDLLAVLTSLLPADRREKQGPRQPEPPSTRSTRR